MDLNKRAKPASKIQNIHEWPDWPMCLTNKAQPNQTNKQGKKMKRHILQELARGVKRRNVRKESAGLVEKWERTPLLNGISNLTEKANMAVLLENQVKELLRESTSMAAGDVQGFASVAFPMVRRVFGKAIANKIVSVQPMSLPAGLIFFIDFVYNTSRLNATADASIQGGGRVASQITGGVLVNDDTSDLSRYGELGFRGLNNGYSSATGSLTGLALTEVYAPFEVDGTNDAANAAIRFDPDLASGSYATVLSVPITAAQFRDTLVGDNYVPILCELSIDTSGSTQVRRLTYRNGTDTALRFVFHATASFSTLIIGGQTATLTFPRKDAWTAVNLGAIVGASPWELEFQTEIPEINLKVDQIPVTAETKKLKAKWSPELAQDLAAFHNVDAESELTGVLSEHIELEIDMELLADLCQGAKAARYYWSREPGNFLNRETGVSKASAVTPPDFTGNVSEWYQTLIETINDASATIYRKIRKGGANFLVTSPEMNSILEMTRGFAANTAVDAEKSDAGTLKTGTVSKKWDVYTSPLFWRNVVLVGRKGSGFLESGYVYAPYVPLQVTPTIPGPEDFTPRKGVMTRFAKKMVQPDFYALVIVKDLV
jgi:hypothetical protein